MKKLLFTLLLAAATLPGWALSQVDGVYQIGTAQDLVDFASLVNGGTGNANAVLTADIDMTEVTGWTPIGQDMKDYKGHFNGQGHRIKNLTTSAGYSNQALFGQAVGPAIIENVIIDASCTIQGVDYTAGILGHVWGDGVIVRNCGNEANINGTGANSAGIVGCSEKIVYISNCYNTGQIYGDRECAGICAWMGSGSSTISNCYSSVNVSKGNQLWRKDEVAGTNMYHISGGQGSTSFTLDDLSSGKLCYSMNGDQSSINWYQNLGEGGDAYPVPFSSHSRVYATGDVRCDGALLGNNTFTNDVSQAAEITSHNYTDPSTGFCADCGAYEPNALTATDGWYEISQPWQLRWMAESVTEHNSTYGNANIKLTADINYSAYTDQAAMFGKEGNTYKGTFDGQCHTVTVAFENNSAEETGLFRRINGGTVKNLKVAGTISTNQKLAGGICSGIWQKGIIQNCESAVTITDNSSSGDATHGGILARVSDKSNTNNGIQILNCLFSGTLNAPNRTGCGGIIGWPDNAVNEVKVHNCIVTGTITLKDDDNNDLIVRNTADVKNCYYSCTLTNNLRNTKSASQIVSGEIATGEFCFKLNEQVSGAENWYQNLPGSVDVLPTPFYTSGKVYANGNFQCDGITPKPGSETTYSNTEGAIIDEHSFANHLCSVCKAVGQEPSATDGVYQIEDIGHLIWFAAHVNEGSATASGKLTADINQSDAVYTPIGSSTNPYHGTFDGGYHTVTLNLTDEGKDNQGIFGVLTGGATINNIIAAGTVKGYSGVGGIAGSTNGGGNVTFNCCGNEAAVTASHANAGGILGVDMASEATITMKNVYSTGAISGGTDNGGLSGWAGDAPYIINAYCTSSVSGNSSSQFIRNNDGTVNFKNTFGSDQITGTMLTDGTLCYKLGAAFTQDLSQTSYPTFGSKQVILNGSYENVATTLTLNDANSFGTNSNFDVTTVTMTRTLKAGKWNTFCVPFDMTAAEITSQLGSGTEVKELTAATLNNDNYTMTFSDASSIVAGKPYMVRVLGENDVTNFSLSDKTIKGTITPTTKGDLTFTGVFNNGYAPLNSFIISNNIFYNVDTDANDDGVSEVALKAFRGYITATSSGSGSGVKVLNFDFDDDATGISLMEDGRSQMEDGAIYNLAGQRINKMQRGINIVNGKKVLK